MGINYARQLPRDRDGFPMPESLPNVPAIQVNVRENGAASSAWTLNSNTTTVQVAAVGGGAAIKWGNNQQTSVHASVGAMAYDAVIPPNQYLLFAVPRFSAGLPNYSGINSPSVVGLNTAEGLYTTIATRSLGVGSVLLTEY